jgi:hypothetical protein
MNILNEVTVIRADYLDSLVVLTWPEKVGFESPCQFEWHNDEVTLQTDCKAYISESVTEWLNDDFGFMGPHQLICALISEGALTPGHYIVKV